MKTKIVLTCFLAIVACSCTNESGPWADFKKCASNDCVTEVLAVKDAFLENPKSLLQQFDATYRKGEDHVIGWIYLLRDSVLLNGEFAGPEQRFELQQAIVEAAKPYENDPKLGEMAQSILNEIEVLAIASEMEDNPEEFVPFTGTYAYELPNEGGSGELKVSILNSGSIRFSLLVVGAPPAYNQGTMEGTATLTAPNVFEYQTTEFGGACRLEFAFWGESVLIKTLEGDPASCGFGNNVVADHEYAVVSHDDPFLSAADAKKAKALNGKWVSTEDAKAEVHIENGMYTDIYDGELISSLPCQYFPQCPKDCNPSGGSFPCIKVIGQDELCYTVVQATGKLLELSLISGTGQSLFFKRQ